jgi:hypothetical protein
MNLVDCHEEKIHISGHIQDFGYIIGLDPSTKTIAFFSQNISEIFNADENVLGETLEQNSHAFAPLLESVVLGNLEFENLPNLADQEDSMVITNQIDNPALYNVCGSVNDVKEVFHSDLFPIVNQADFLFCFGFNEEEFMRFCNQSNLIGILNDHVVRDNDTKNSINGMAFWIDREKSWNHNYKNVSDIITLCLKERRYVPKHNKKLLGVIYQGKGFDIAKESKMPLLYV